MLVLSWRRAPVPAPSTSPACRGRDPQTAEEKRAEAGDEDRPRRLVRVRPGCFVCHSISALGVKSPAQIGPDLSTAVEDTQKRFGLTRRRLPARARPGTMSVVLSRQIILDAAQQKEVAIQKLREAFADRTSGSKAAAPATRAGKSSSHSERRTPMRLSTIRRRRVRC